MNIGKEIVLCMNNQANMAHHITEDQEVLNHIEVGMIHLSREELKEQGIDNTQMEVTGATSRDIEKEVSFVGFSVF